MCYLYSRARHPQVLYRLVVARYHEVYAVTQLAIVFYIPSMAVHLSSVALQFLLFGSVDLLIKQIDRVVPSLCSCPTPAPNPSMDASVISWNIRSPEIAA